MKNIYRLLIYILVFYPFFSFAQDESIVRFFKTGKENGQKLLQEYIGSANEALGFTLNNGWYQGADIKKVGRFTLKVIGNLSVSNEEETFSITNLGLNNVVLSSENQSAFSPSLMTNNRNGQNVAYVVEGDTLSNFKMPDGLGFMPAIFLQANIGLPYRTEAMLRFLPNIATNSVSSDANGTLWGFGLKHDIQQWIPRVNLWSVRLALGFGFTHFQGKLNTISNPDIDPVTGEFYPQLSSEVANYSNQNVVSNVNAWNLALLASKKLATFTIYTGIRYDRSSATLEVLGTYPFTTVNPEGEKQTINITNPFNKQQNFSQISLNTGLRVKLGPAQVFVDASLGQTFFNINSGLGFGWGKN